MRWMAAAITLLSISTSTGCLSRVPLDPNRPVEVRQYLMATYFLQDGQYITNSSLTRELEKDRETAALVNGSRMLSFPGLTGSLAGGMMVGWEAGRAGDAERPVNRTKIGIGTGLVIAGTVLAILGENTYLKAVDTYNARFDEERDRQRDQDAKQKRRGNQSAAKRVSLIEEHEKKRKWAFVPLLDADDSGGTAGAMIVW